MLFSDYNQPDIGSVANVGSELQSSEMEMTQKHNLSSLSGHKK